MAQKHTQMMWLNVVIVGWACYVTGLQSLSQTARWQGKEPGNYQGRQEESLQEDGQMERERGR